LCLYTSSILGGGRGFGLLVVFISMETYIERRRDIGFRIGVETTVERIQTTKREESCDRRVLTGVENVLC